MLDQQLEFQKKSMETIIAE